MKLYVCGVTGLYRKWLNRPELSATTVQDAALAAIDYFQSIGFDAEINSSCQFWLECPMDLPYLYIAVEKYNEKMRKPLRVGADKLLEKL